MLLRLSQLLMAGSRSQRIVLLPLEEMGRERLQSPGTSIRRSEENLHIAREPLKLFE